MLVCIFGGQGKIALLLDMLHNASATVENEQEDATIKELEGMSRYCCKHLEIRGVQRQQIAVGMKVCLGLCHQP